MAAYYKPEDKFGLHKSKNKLAKIKILIKFEFGALAIAPACIPPNSRAARVFSKWSGFASWRNCDNSVSKLLVSPRCNKWFEAVRAGK